MARERIRRALALGAVLLASCSADERPSLVLITLDTTRADHLGPYGYTAARTPTLDRFAAGAVLYERAYATSSWTLPSHASLLTGLLPMQHGAQAVAGAPAGELGYGVRPLAPRFATLAEWLREAGYRTGAVVAGPALRRDLGVAQGFERYEDDLSGAERTLHGKRAEEVSDLALGLIEDFGDAPFFLFVNYFDPHAPYRPPPPHDRGLPQAAGESRLGAAYVERLESGAPPVPLAEREEWERRALAALRAGYDAEIAYMDAQLGRLLDAVEAARGPAGALVAVTGDHGESFGEHYFLSHGAHLYEDNVRVPLLVRWPGGGGAGRRIDDPVQNHRLFATFLGVAGLDADGAPDLDAPAAPIVTEVRRSDANIRLFGPYFDRDLRAVHAPPWKRIESSKGPVELYDLAADPRELSDRAAEQPEVARSLSDWLGRYAEAHPPRFDPEARAELTPQTEEALRALGYLE